MEVNIIDCIRAGIVCLAFGQFLGQTVPMPTDTATVHSRTWHIGQSITDETVSVLQPGGTNAKLVRVEILCKNQKILFVSYVQYSSLNKEFEEVLTVAKRQGYQPILLCVDSKDAAKVAEYRDTKGWNVPIILGPANEQWRQKHFGAHTYLPTNNSVIQFMETRPQEIIDWLQRQNHPPQGGFSLQS